LRPAFFGFLNHRREAAPVHGVLMRKNIMEHTFLLLCQLGVIKQHHVQIVKFNFAGANFQKKNRPVMH
jgi:hypothetical protein